MLRLIVVVLFAHLLFPFHVATNVTQPPRYGPPADCENWNLEVEMDDTLTFYCLGAYEDDIETDPSGGTLRRLRKAPIGSEVKIILDDGAPI